MTVTTQPNLTVDLEATGRKQDRATVFGGSEAATTPILGASAHHGVLAHRTDLRAVLSGASLVRTHALNAVGEIPAVLSVLVNWSSTIKFPVFGMVVDPPSVAGVAARETSNLDSAEISAEIERRGAPRASWETARRALEHELARLSPRLVRWSAELASPMEPGEEPLIALDVVLRTREEGDSTLQDHLQQAACTGVPDEIRNLVVVSFLYVT